MNSEQITVALVTDPKFVLSNYIGDDYDPKTCHAKRHNPIHPTRGLQILLARLRY